MLRETAAAPPEISGPARGIKGAGGASTFDSEGNDLAQPGRPAMETLVTPRCSGQPALIQPGAKAINCHGYMFVSVCVDSDNDPGNAYGVGTCHSCLLMLDGISSSRPGERTGLREGLWPSSYQVTAHPIGGLSGPPREQVDRSQGRHCAGPIMGQARAEEARV